MNPGSKLRKLMFYPSYTTRAYINKYNISKVINVVLMYRTYITLLLPALISFLVTLIGTKFLIGYMKGAGVVGIDRNRKIVLASSGGIAVALGFAIGILAYSFGGSFPNALHPWYIPVASLKYLFASVLAVILISIVGFIDDINVKRTLVKSTDIKDIRQGLKQWQKPLLTLIGAIPLMAVNAGVSAIHIPFFGLINFGIFYPLVIIPLAIIFAANSFNLVESANGMGAGGGLIVSMAMFVYSVVFGTYMGALLSGVLFASILGFFFFNKYPAKILSGDSFTYAAGAGIVITMILGSMEAFGVIIFLPWIIEFVLHARKRFKVTTLGKRRKDGTFRSPYGKKIYSWTHIIMNLGRVNEWQLSAYMWIMEFGFVILGFGLKLLHVL